MSLCAESKKTKTNLQHSRKTTLPWDAAMDAGMDVLVLVEDFNTEIPSLLNATQQGVERRPM